MQAAARLRGHFNAFLHAASRQFGPPSGQAMRYRWHLVDRQTGDNSFPNSKKPAFSERKNKLYLRKRDPTPAESGQIIPCQIAPKPYFQDTAGE